MSENNGIFIVRSIANTVNTISELDVLIVNEKDEVRINELKKKTRTAYRSSETIGTRARR